MGKDISRFSMRFDKKMYDKIKEISDYEFLTFNTLIKQVIQKKLREITKEN